MKYEFNPRGVCSRKMTLEIEDGIIRDLKVEGLQRQLAGYFRAGKGNECGGGYRKAFGNPMRLKAHVLPCTACGGFGEIKSGRCRLNALLKT